MTPNMERALSRLADGDVIIYTPGDPDEVAIEAVWYDRHPQLGVHMRTFRTAQRRGWIARGLAPAGSTYRDEPTFWQAWLITPAGLKAASYPTPTRR